MVKLKTTLLLSFVMALTISGSLWCKNSYKYNDVIFVKQSGKEGVYFDEKAQHVTESFNAKYADTQDEFAPVMFRLKEQNNLAGYLDYVDSFSSMFVIIFVIVMSIVLWNTGLLGIN